MVIKKGFEDFAKGIKLAFIEAYCFGTIVKRKNEIQDLKRFLIEIEELRKTAIVRNAVVTHREISNPELSRRIAEIMDFRRTLHHYIENYPTFVRYNKA